MWRDKVVITTLLVFLIILTGCAREAPVFPTPPPTGPVVVKQSGGVGLLISQCQDKQYVINVADYIVEGIVEMVESKWNEDNSAILTYTDLSIFHEGKRVRIYFQEDDGEFRIVCGRFGVEELDLLIPKLTKP